jgi:hypothetical protein
MLDVLPGNLDLGETPTLYEVQRTHRQVPKPEPQPGE